MLEVQRRHVHSAVGVVTLLIDTPSQIRIGFVRETMEHGDRRAYYVAEAHWLAVVVLCNGLDLETVADKVVNADIAVAPAPATIARPGNEGKPHTIVSVHSLSADLADFCLVLAMERLSEDGSRIDSPT